MKIKSLVRIIACIALPGLTARGDEKQAVTADNFIRAESDLYFGNSIKSSGGPGKFHHYREMMPIDKQAVIRANRDTLYSSAVIDLDAGPVTIVLPGAGKRFRSLFAINEDHYVVGDVKYDAGSYTYDRAQTGTRYLLIGLRTMVNPEDANDVAEVHALQDATKINQEKPGSFEIPEWDAASQKKVREALLVLGSTIPDFKNAFGNKGKVDPIRHLIGTATGWGGNPDKDASYLNVTPAKNDGKAVYRLTVKDVPVDGFWSISLYDAEGYFVQNPQKAYSVNNLTAKKDADGSVTIQFGGESGAAPNVLPVMPGWNCTVRLYRPRPEILDGRWKFPEPQAVE